MDASIYTEIVATAAGAVLPQRLINTDAGFHTQLVVARDASIVQPSIQTLSGAGRGVTTPGSFKGTGGAVVSAQLYTQYIVNSEERRYYIARETVDLSGVTLYPPTNVTITRDVVTGEYSLTFDEPTGSQANPEGETVYVVYYDSRAGQILLPGGANILQVGGVGGLQASQTVFVRAEYIPLPSRVSEFSAGIQLVYRPRGPALSAAVGPGDKQVTLTMVADSAAPAGVNISSISVTYSKTDGETGIINGVAVGPIAPGATAAVTITLPTNDVAYSISVAGVAVVTDESNTVTGVIPRQPPALSAVTSSLVGGGVQITIGTVTVSGGNPLVTSGNVLVKFARIGAAPVNVYQTISGAGSFTILTANVLGLVLGVQYTITVTPIAQFLDGAEAMAGTATFGLPRDVSGLAATAIQPTGSLLVTWNQATSYDPVAAPITGYVLTYRRADGAGGTTTVTVNGGATTTYTVSGLTAQIQYTLTVRALTTYGQSVGAATETGTPLQYSAPAVPSDGDLQLYQFDSTYGVKIAVVPSTGSAPIDGYRLYRREGASPTSVLIGSLTQPTSAAIDTLFLKLMPAGGVEPVPTQQYVVDLAAAGAAASEAVLTLTTIFTLGTNYTFIYTAYNTSGESATTTIGTATCISLPARTFSGLAAYSSPGGAGTYKLVWTNGGTVSVGRPVDVIRYYEGGVKSPVTLAGADSPSSWSGLALSAATSVEVVAENAIGEGVRSTAAVVPAWMAETAVAGVSGAVGFQQLVVSWTPKATTWGIATSGYRVVVGGLEQTVGAGASQATFTVVNGQSYTTSVYSRNALGEESAAGTAGPFVIEDAGPAVGTRTGDSHEVSLAWSAKATTWGAATVGYRIYKSVNGGAYELAASVAAGTLSRTISGLPNLVTIVFGITAVNGAGQESSITTWTPIQLSADVPVLTWDGVVTGLGSGSVRVFKPAEAAGTNPDGLVGQDSWQLDISGVVSTISFGAAAWLDLSPGALVNGETYSIRLRRKYVDIPPWSADEYFTAWTEAVEAVPFAPVVAALTGSHVSGQSLAARLQWSVEAPVAQYFEGGYYFVVQIVRGAEAPYYRYFYDADTIDQDRTITVDAPGEHTFSLAITNVDISAANIPSAVWSATVPVTFTVFDAPEQPGLTNELVFDAAGGATDTFRVSAGSFPFPDGRPVTEYKLYDTDGNILVGSAVTDASAVEFPYTYSLAALGGTKQFEAVAVNSQVGRSVPTFLTVTVVGSPPYAARDATAVAVTGQAISASGATATLGWTKYEPNSTYFHVTGFRVDVSSGGAWVELGSYGPTATGSGTLNVTGYVVDGQALTFRVVQLGAGGDSAGIVVASAAYTVPVVGTAALGTLTAADRAITVPWTYTGVVANITGLVLDISGLSGTVQESVPLAAAASGSYVYNATVYEPYAFRIRGVNSFTVGAWSTYSSIVPAAVPEQPLVSNALVFDAAGNATDTFTVTMPTVPLPTGRPVTGYKLRRAGVDISSITTDATSVTFSYVYPLVDLGTSVTFEVVAVNAVGDSVARSITVAVVGSPPYATRDATGVSVSAQTIAGSGATATLSWTKNEPNAAYFPVTGFRVDISASGTWVTLGSYGPAATGSGAINVTNYVVDGQAMLFRVVQLGPGGNSGGVVVASAAYVVPAIGTAAVGTLSAADKAITVPWTYTGALANITGLVLDISGLGGAVQDQVSLGAAASDTYVYNAASYGVYSFRIRAQNVFAVGAFSAAAAITISEALFTYKSIAAGGGHTAAVLEDGTMRIWGSGANGRLGIGPTVDGSYVDMSRAVTPCNISNVISVAAGSHTVALLSDGTIRTWGAGSSGQLGNDATLDMSRAVTPCNISNVTAVAAGQTNTIVLLTDGTIRAWGGNSNGQLGNGSTVNTSTAVIPDISNVVAISTFAFHSAALLADGTIRTWGFGSSGQLGNNSTTASQTIPVTPCNISNVIAIATGFTHTAALLADGTMRTWGQGTNGRLGIGSTNNAIMPVTPTGVSNVVAIVAGLGHTTALLVNGTIRTWGQGTNGRLGIGSVVDMSTAVTPCNISNVIDVACQGSYTAALLADGSMRMWGFGSSGQLGNGAMVDMSTAVTPCNISNVAVVKPFGIGAVLTTITNIYNSDQIDYVLRDLSALFWPGTVRPYQGIAVVDLAGTWEYSVDNGISWVNFPAVSATSAMLLTSSARIRSSAAASGTDTLTVKAWTGQITGAAFALVYTAVDTTVTGGTIAGVSYSDSTTILRNNDVPAPVAPTDLSAVSGPYSINIVTLNTTQSRFVSSYMIDVSGLGAFTTTAVPYVITGISTGIYSVRARIINVAGNASDYSSAIAVTVSESVPITYKSIAGGDGYTVALLEDGTIRGWGGNNIGQLGNNATTTRQLTPVSPCNISNVIAVSGGALHTAALLADGTMRTWGAGAFGQLGNGLTTSSIIPVTPTGISNVVAIATGASNTIALLSDGTMRAWGLNANGQLGNSSTTNSSTAVTSLGISNVVAIAAGVNNTAALLADGTIRAWGEGGNGQLGDGSVTASQTTPVTVLNISNAVAIACGGVTTIALLADGTTRTWGAGAFGQLGDNSVTTSRTFPVTPCNISNVAAVAASRYTAVLLADGTMRTWGQGTNGKLGNNSTADVSRAVTPLNISNCVAITAAIEHTMALLADGTMRTWGLNSTGQLGNNSTTNSSIAVTPVGVSNVAIVEPFGLVGASTATTDIYDTDYVKYILGDLSHVFWPGTINPYKGLAVVGLAGTWEYSINGGTSWVSFPDVSAASAVLLTGNVRVKSSAAASGSDTLTVKAWTSQIANASDALVYTDVNTTVTDGTLAGVSYSYVTSTLKNNLQPVPPVPTDLSAVGGLEQFTVTTLNVAPRFFSSYTIDAGTGGTYSIASVPSIISGVPGGTYFVRARTVNRDGVESVDSSAVSVTVITPAPITYRSIDAANGYTLALLTDGTIRAWGYGGEGNLGNGSNTNQLTAVTPTGVSNVVAISASFSTTAALLADGTMRTWGAGGNGQLGNGSTTATQTTAVTPTGVSNVVAIAVGRFYMAALLADGTMRTWGAGGEGQLGNGSTTASQLTPVTPTGVSNVVAIAAGSNHTAALLANGTMRTWGRGAEGQLGNGSNNIQLTAVTPTGVSNVVAIAAGSNHTAALLANGAMRTWGAGSVGQLGNGATGQQNIAVTPTGVSNAVAVAAGNSNTAALLADGTVRTWGGGDFGQLGNGTLPISQTIAVTPTGVSNVVAIRIGANYMAALLADGTMRTWGTGSVGRLGNGSIADMSTAVTPCNISNVAIVKPSFANRTVAVNTDLSFAYFMAISTGYKPGTVPYRGMALVDATGTWEYSTNSGSTWTTVGAVTTTSAVALRLEPTVRIRCTVAGVLSVKAWSAQQAVPATVTAGVDTTVVTATIEGYSFAEVTTTITAA